MIISNKKPYNLYFWKVGILSYPTSVGYKIYVEHDGDNRIVIIGRYEVHIIPRHSSSFTNL